MTLYICTHAPCWLQCSAGERESSVICLSNCMLRNFHARRRNSTWYAIIAVSGSCWGAAATSVITFRTHRSPCALSGRHLRLQPQICPRILAPCRETRRFQPPVLEYRLPDPAQDIEFHGESALVTHFSIFRTESLAHWYSTLVPRYLAGRVHL